MSTRKKAQPWVAHRRVHHQPIVLAIAVLSHDGRVHAGFMRSMLKLTNELRRREIAFVTQYIEGLSLVHVARDVAAAGFLAEPRTTHLLFADSDQEFEPSTVFAMLDSGKELVAAPVPMKRVPLTYGKYEPIGPAEGDFIRVTAAGTGLMVIRRIVFEKIAAAHPELQYFADAHEGDGAPMLHRFAFFQPILAQGRSLGEDHAFCVRWRELGGEVWLYLRADITHFGPHAFRGDHPVLVDMLAEPRADR